MNFPTSLVITCCDALSIWKPALTARSFKPFIADELADLLAKTLPVPGEGKHRTAGG
jgi:hypothetical protein